MLTVVFFSYVALIAIVLNESKEKQLTLREIYTAIMNKWPFYREASAFKWQNSIRHNLSLNNCFEKIAKQGSANKKVCLSVCCTQYDLNLKVLYTI